MTRGIDNAQCTVVFVTQRYMNKVDGDDPNDNCQLEFNYATNRKSANKMVAVVMEERMRNTNNWVGELGMVLGPRLYVDCCGNLDETAYYEKTIDEIFAAVIKVIGKPVRGWPNQGGSSSKPSPAPAPAPAPKPAPAPAPKPAPKPAPAPKPTPQPSSYSSGPIEVSAPTPTLSYDRPDEDDDGEIIPIVIDVGSMLTRGGFAGQDNPYAVIKHDEGFLQEGVVADIDALEKELHRMFYQELRVDPEEHLVLITEVPGNPKNVRELITRLLFETFNIPGCYLAPRPTLSLYANGRTTGISLHCGHQTSWVAPVYDGYVLLHASVKSSVGGRTITQTLLQRLVEHGYDFGEEELNNLKATACFVATDVNDEACRHDEDQSYVINGEMIQLGRMDRCVPPEVLFNPAVAGQEDSGLHELVYASIMKCDVDIRKELFANIIVSGGSSLLPGFTERLHREVQMLAPSSYAVKVVAPPERANIYWIGGSILSSLSTFNEM